MELYLQKLEQVARDVGEPRREIVLKALSLIKELSEQNARLFSQLEQVKRVANNLAGGCKHE